MGSPTAAHYLADLADIEVCTAREWIRVGRRLRELPATADAFASRRISYAKARALTRFATPENELELLAIADRTPAGDLNRALAAWLRDSSSPEELDEWHQRWRSVTWRTEPDGMVTFTLRLPPHIAAILISLLTVLVMRMRPTADASGAYPTSPQQHADALHQLLAAGVGSTTTEVIFHVRGDGCTADDGTPVPETAIASMLDEARLRAMIHDADGRPINASAARRHPTTRQKRVVKERVVRSAHFDSCLANARQLPDASASTADAPTCSSTTTSPPTRPATPPWTNSSSAAHPATTAGTWRPEHPCDGTSVMMHRGAPRNPGRSPDRSARLEQWPEWGNRR